MPTPSSGATAYADHADLTARFDVRVVCQLASDENVKLAPDQLPTSARVLAKLAEASGLVEAAVMKGGMYSVEDLAALTGNSLAFLKGLVCKLAMGELFLARPDRDGKPPAYYDMALDILDQLSDGQLVFGLAEQQDAGGAVQVTVEPAAGVEARAGVVVEAQRLFSRRNNRLHG